MNSRLELQGLLASIAGKNVYYQPPSNIEMLYPAIVYNKNKIENIHADGVIYSQYNHYTITVISKTVDDIIVDKVSKISRCRFDRAFIQDSLYHTVFNLYY